MRLLLDTHILLWALGKSDRLSHRARDLIEAPENDVLFSAVSIWEMSIKAARRLSDFHAPPEEILAQAIAAGFREVPVESRTALKVVDLPLHHNDPFDRLIVVQAIR